MERTSLLARLDAELGGGPGSWTNLVIVRNTGPIRAANPLPGDRMSNRGFNALLIGTMGLPTHYLKVRPTVHDGFEREVQVHMAMVAHPDGRRLAPPAQTFVLGPMRVLVQDYIQGYRFDGVLKEKSRGAAWREPVGAFLAHSAEFWTILEDILAPGTPTDQESRTLARVGETFTVLSGLGLRKSAASRLEGRIGDLILPSRPQHGDFWPRNILELAGGWRILDFESCGEIDLPLYDFFHLVRGALGFAVGWEPGVWLARWAAGGSQRDRFWEAQRRLTERFSVAQIEGTLVCYLSDFCVRLFRRGLSRDALTPWLRELEFLVDGLNEGLVRKAVAG
jgi:hypothetical protein